MEKKTQIQRNTERFRCRHYLASYKNYHEYSQKEFFTILQEAIKITDGTILNYIFNELQNGGMSALILLDNSHCCIHVYPEQKTMFMDLFTYSNCDLMKFHKIIIEFLKPTSVYSEIIFRH